MMAVQNELRIVCDAPGCMSYCKLASTKDLEDVPGALKIRGWDLRPGDEGDRHMCPAHVGRWELLGDAE